MESEENYEIIYNFSRQNFVAKMNFFCGIKYESYLLFYFPLLKLSSEFFLGTH